MRSLLFSGVALFSVVALALAQTPPLPPPLPKAPPVAAPEAGQTNRPAVAPIVPNAFWKELSGAAEMPGAHHLVTNSDGKVMVQYNMHPVVTNMAALTNELPELEKQNQQLQSEMDALLAKDAPLRAAVREGATALSAIATNTASADDEEKKLRARLDELGAQIKEVQSQLQKKLDAKPEFQKAKTKFDEDQAAYKALVEKKKELMERRGPIQMKIWKIKQLLNQERIKAEAKAKADEKAKVKTDDKAQAPAVPPAAPVQP